MHNLNVNAIGSDAITCSALSADFLIPAIRISSYNMCAGTA
jgi:hypothetical protein